MNGATDYRKLIGERIKQYRINRGYSQLDMEEKTGVSVRSISRLEQGASIQLDSLIKILEALDLAGNLELLVPDQTKRPSYYLENGEKRRQRVGKKKTTQSDFKWGDEM